MTANVQPSLQTVVRSPAWGHWIRPTLLSFAWVVLGGLVFIALWQGIILVFEIPSYLMASPQMTWNALLRERQVLWRNTGVTLWEMVAGLGVGSTFALVLAALCTRSAVAERTIMPFAITLRSIPVVAIAPLITLLVGRGLGTSIVVATIVCFFPMLVNAVQGFKSTQRTVQELFHVCGADPWQTFWWARVPFALPYLFTGLRTAAPAAVLGAMLAEWLTGTQGLGYMIIHAASRRDQGLLWAVVILSTLLALGVFWLVAALERWLTYWAK